MMYAVLYGDVLMSLVNQTEPYEQQGGKAQALAERYTDELAKHMDKDGVSFAKFKKNCRRMLEDFAAIGRCSEQPRRVRVGVVGEIYVKFSPLGNNNLAKFLIENGAEVIVPGLLDFCLYCVYNSLMDHELYGVSGPKYWMWKFFWNFLTARQKNLILLLQRDGRFDPPTPIEETITLIRRHMHLGVKMGEGWLLPAEMLELYTHGAKNIVCTQPFGCLPNHICGKGMMKPLRDAYPDINIVAIDYDAGATRVNQENRIKLMLANAMSNQPTNHTEKR
jgi:predicted nucleotide-binding protein (sugar kinase/HSP70/actin superfamily)